MSRLSKLADRLIRPFATHGFRLVRAVRFSKDARATGVHALALTPEQRLILVKLRYAPGWRLPGGGRRSDEDSGEAALRELHEEIGMTGHGRVRAAPGLGSLIIVEQVCFHPRRWSWEVERIIEADLDSLPADLSPRAAAWIEAARKHI